MRRANSDDTEQTGQDSFLDIVANIVGILILLVMVMGLRASHSVATEESPQAAVAADMQQAAPPVSDQQLKDAVKSAVTTNDDVRNLVQRAVQVHQEAAMREEERGYLATFVAAVEQELEDRRGELNEQEQQEYDVRRRLGESQETLDDLMRQKVSLVSQMSESDITEIESLPTPLSKTVSGKEIHLRLAHGHVALAPVDQLREQFEAQAERDVWRLRDQNRVFGTVGPIDGFRLRYQLAKGRVTVQQEPGLERQATVVRFVSWELLPTAPTLGEPTAQAMLPNSDLRRALRQYAPESTTVTIWTYPDSFDDFRELKRMLFESGYATAGRPLPEGVRIGASPSGKKSSAQ